MQKTRKRRLVRIANTGLVVVTLASLGVALTSRGGSADVPPPPTAVVERQDLDVVVTANGTIPMSGQADLTFVTPGRLTELSVGVGDRVQAGQVVARVDDTPAQEELARAVADRDTALARITQLQNPQTGADAAVARAQVEQARQALDAARAAAGLAREGVDSNIQSLLLTESQARNQLARDVAARDAARLRVEQAKAAAATGAEGAAEQLRAAEDALRAAEEAVAKADEAVGTAHMAVATAVDRDAQSVQQADASVAAAERSLALAEATAAAGGQGPKPGDLESAQAAVAIADIAVQQAQRKIDETVLMAPADGVVSAVAGRVGEQSSGTGATVTIVDVAASSIRVGFVEVDAAQLAPGQSASVTIAGVDEPLAGTVVRVEPAATVVNNVVTVYAEIAITDAPSTLRPGQSGKASVTVAEAKDVLAVPASALAEIDGEAMVLLPSPSGGEPEPQPVSTGTRSGGFVEITAGLDEGQEIVVLDGMTQ
jgi:HlyD family secretion protein